MVGTGKSSPDGRTGGGYGTLGGTGLGHDSEAEAVWPYRTVTDIEKLATDSPDTEKKNRDSIRKKNKKHFASDRLAQLNYKPHSFVNGSTRGLTGIMSGVEPRDLLELFIKEAIGKSPVVRRAPRERFKPIGTGAPNPITMSSDPTTRTRPGMTLGSKQGWFSPPPPKDTDPVMFEPASGLDDIAKNQDERPLLNVNIEKRRAHKKNNTNESKDAILRSYVMIVVNK